MFKKSEMRNMLKISVCSVAVGVICGLIGSLFHGALHFAAEAFSAAPLLIFFLIPAGLLIVYIYKRLKVSTDFSTNSVIKAVRSNENLPNGLSLSIFASTFLTHLFGGSSGREGAALQLGGSVGDIFSEIKWLKFKEKDRSTFAMCGMSGLFSALFGTPIAAAVFVLRIINVKKYYKTAALPCLISSYIAYAVAFVLGNGGVRYTISDIKYDLKNLSCIFLIVVAGALISIVFCSAMEHSKKLAKKISNEYVRIAVGGAAVVALTLLLNTNDYNGAGSSVIEFAIAGAAEPEAFALKIVLTAVTLAFGYKGGEIVPSFFVGATLGCVLGLALGIDPGVAAAIGMMSVFCGVTNCPIATIVMAGEVFGMAKMPVFIPVCLLVYVFSGKHSLYGSRTFSVVDYLKNPSKKG